MDVEEVLLAPKNSSETGQDFDEPIRDKISKVVIGEDLRRAIVALRSVPKVNWSSDSIYGDNSDGLASTEYIWKATDFPGNSSFPADWKRNDRNRRTLLTNNATEKVVAGQLENQSEIMRRDSLTIASKRLDHTSDSTCRLVEESATSVQMSLFSGAKRGKANSVGEKSSRSTPSGLAASSPGAEVPRKPPPLPPKPARLQGFQSKQLVTGKLDSHGKRTSGGAQDLVKTDMSRNGKSLDVVDIYERSLDVLEKDDSDLELEDLTSPRSDSPECLLEELLGSVPAEEFDTSECQKNPINVASNNGGTLKTDLLSFDNLGKRSTRSEKQDSRETEKKHTNGSGMEFIPTSSAETASCSQTNSVKHEKKKNLSLKLVDTFAESAARQLDFITIKRNHTLQTDYTSSSKLSPEQKNGSALTGASDRELTPEDIFEEIMDSLETHHKDREQNGVQLHSSGDTCRNQKHPQHELSRRSACDYILENEWLSIYCGQTQPEAQHEIITGTRISDSPLDAVINTSPSESAKSSTGDAVSQSKQIPDAVQNPITTLPSQDGKANITSQDTLQATVKRKPVPPLREKVQTYTFAKQDSLLCDVKLAPAAKPETLAPKKDTTIFDNELSVSNSMNSCTEYKYEPLTAEYKYSETRRSPDTSSTESRAVLHGQRNITKMTPGDTISNTRPLQSGNDRLSPPKAVIVTILTRDSELPGCDQYEEEMDLDLETELSRNLDACTASDVECQSIDNLVTSESLFSSDAKVIRRPKKSSGLEVKGRGKLGELLAKKKLKKTRSVEKTEEVVCPHRNEPVNSNQKSIQENTTISIFGQGISTAKEARDNSRVKESPEFSENKSGDLTNINTSSKISQGYPKDSELLRYQASLEESSVDAEDPRSVVADSSGSDNEETYNRTIIRKVRSVEKESRTGREVQQQELQVVSDEVTSQEIVLKIAWPKRESKGQSRVNATGKPPFRELQLKRVVRISDLDNPLNVLPKVATSQPVLAVTQQPSNALRPEMTSVSIFTLPANDSRALIPAEIKSPIDQTVATRNSSEIAVEYENQVNCRRLERVSDSTIDVYQTDTVRILRVPMAAVHKVQDIKEAVAAVGSTILDDFKRQPKKRNIRVTCEAVESKSRASLHDEDITVIRNTIVDTYGRKPELVSPSGPTNSV